MRGWASNIFPLLLSLSACVATEHQRILPATLNLPVLHGSTLMSACNIALVPEAANAYRPPAAQCVAVPSTESLRLQNAYVSALQTAGWSFEGGAANVFWFERPTSSSCMQRLDFIGLPRGIEGDTEAGVVFVFALVAEPICRAPEQ